MERFFQADKESQQQLNEAITKVEFFTLFREYVIQNILLKNKDKNLRFDPQNKIFIETYEEDTNSEPAGREDATPIR